MCFGAPSPPPPPPPPGALPVPSPTATAMGSSSDATFKTMEDFKKQKTGKSSLVIPYNVMSNTPY